MIQLSISGDNPNEFMLNLKAIAAMTGETVVAATGPNMTNPDAPAKRGPGRPPKAANEQKADGAGAATSGTIVDDDPLGLGTGKAGADPDLMATPPAAKADTGPQFKSPEEFIDAVKKLLGKGKDDAVRGKLKELGFEKVRDVPPDKYVSTLAELGKV